MNDTDLLECAARPGERLFPVTTLKSCFAGRRLTGGHWSNFRRGQQGVRLVMTQESPKIFLTSIEAVQRFAAALGWDAALTERGRTLLAEPAPGAAPATDPAAPPRDPKNAQPELFTFQGDVEHLEAKIAEAVRDQLRVLTDLGPGGASFSPAVGAVV